MKTLQGEYAIGELCAAFEVSRSGFHRWRTAEPCERAREDARISELLRAVHRQSRGTYGRPRLVAALRQRGYRCSPKRVARAAGSVTVLWKTWTSWPASLAKQDSVRNASW